MKKNITVKGLEELTKKDLLEITGGGNAANLLGYLVAKALVIPFGPLGQLYVDYAYFND